MKHLKPINELFGFWDKKTDNDIAESIISELSNVKDITCSSIPSQEKEIFNFKVHDQYFAIYKDISRPFSIMPEYFLKFTHLRDVRDHVGPKLDISNSLAKKIFSLCKSIFDKENGDIEATDKEYKSSFRSKINASASKSKNFSGRGLGSGSRYNKSEVRGNGRGMGG